MSGDDHKSCQYQKTQHHSDAMGSRENSKGCWHVSDGTRRSRNRASEKWWLNSHLIKRFATNFLTLLENASSMNRYRVSAIVAVLV
jgi:hypothetical protein